ncbi:MAG: type ISP restriction/modification enzyme [Brevinema sp.]
MNKQIKELFNQYLIELRNTSLFEKSEYTDRPALTNLLQKLNIQFKTEIRVIHEGKDSTRNKPDFHITKGDILIGLIENKKMGENLDNILSGEQIDRYKQYKVPVLVTDYWNFIVIKDNKIVNQSCLGSTQLIDNKTAKLQESAIEETALLINDFFETAIGENIVNLSELIRKLSFKTAQLRQFIVKGLDSHDKKLEKLKSLLNNSIYEEIDQSNVADTIAQMLIYFAFVNKVYQNKELKTFSDLLNGIPPYLSFIKELLTILNMSIEENHLIREIFDILNATDINKIKTELSQSDDKDPFVYFYEDFLRAYDTKMSKDMGVYYTPKPVVDFMVRQSNYFLKNYFGKKGLHDKNVTTLDFATGTGTFVQSIIECILDGKQAGDIQTLTEEHILKNVYAFELMPAPYTVAHMKLSELLINKGYQFKDEERLQIYLTNTLTTSKKVAGLFFDELDKEMERAQDIKDNQHILFICGNPPYNNRTQNKNSTITTKSTQHKGKRISKYTAEGLVMKTTAKEAKPFDKILKLLEDYKFRLTGQNDKFALNNDYIKFIRFAHDKIMKTSEGIICIITPNSFLEKISFRVMREKLIQDFDELYFINLHGESGTRGAKASSDDQNVFDIQEGVCISYFVKSKERTQKEALVKYLAIQGSRAEKFDLLTKMKNQSFESFSWKEITPNKNNLFTFTDSIIDYSLFEQDHFWALDKIFNIFSLGISSERDILTIQSSKSNLQSILNDFSMLDVEILINKYSLINSRDWKINKARIDIQKLCEDHIIKIVYRPFDVRYTYLSKKSKGFLAFPRYEVMKHMLHKNIALNFTKTHGQSVFHHSYLSRVPTSRDLVNSKTYHAPLYLYTNKIEDERHENFTPDFRKFIDKYYSTHYTPEQILYYIYAILHHQGYRDKYNEELKKDFAYIPFVKDNERFLQFSALGEKLALAHTDYIIPNNYKHQSEHVGVTSDFSIQSREVQIKENKLYYNKNNYFNNVSAEIFNFKIGGYQVLKTLIVGSAKNPKKELSSDDRDHIETVISVLRYTIDTMKEIEKIQVE